MTENHIVLCRCNQNLPYIQFNQFILSYPSFISIPFSSFIILFHILSLSLIIPFFLLQFFCSQSTFSSLLLLFFSSSSLAFDCLLVSFHLFFLSVPSFPFHFISLLLTNFPFTVFPSVPFLSRFCQYPFSKLLAVTCHEFNHSIFKHVQSQLLTSIIPCGQLGTLSSSSSGTKTSTPSLLRAECITSQH